MKNKYSSISIELVVLTLLSIFFLITIGLYPAIALHRSKDLELGGLFYVFLSWIIWIPATVLSIAVYKIFQRKIMRTSFISSKIVLTIAIMINVVGCFSLTPLNLINNLYDFKKYGFIKVVPSVRDVELHLINPDLTKGTVNYTLNLDNKGTKDLTNIDMSLVIGYKSTDKSFPGAWPLGQYGVNSPNERINIPLGKSQIYGVIPVDLMINNIMYSKINTPIEFYLTFDIGLAHHIEYEIYADQNLVKEIKKNIRFDKKY